MKTNNSFLGRGWGFPPEFSKKSKSVLLTEDEEDIEKSLEILLSTRLEERIMLPEYGCKLDELLFKPLDLSLKTYVIDLIETAILYYEPRIDAESINIEQSSDNEGLLLIVIEYIVRNTNSRKNLVYPFYKAEGTEKV